jgi:hypothetical protein
MCSNFLHLPEEPTKYVTSFKTSKSENSTEFHMLPTESTSEGILMKMTSKVINHTVHYLLQ